MHDGADTHHDIPERRARSSKADVMEVKLNAREGQCFELALSGSRRTRVEKLGHRRNQLGWSKRLFQQNAVGHSLRCPIVGGSARHVDDGKCGIDLPDKARNLPPLHRPFDVDIGYERRILDHVTFDDGHSFLSGSDRREIEAALLQGVMNSFLQ